MPQSFVSQYLHITFSTKHREKTITAELRERLHPYIAGIVKNEAGKLLAIGGVADHVHLLVSINQQTALADLVRVIKTNSSKWIHETFPNLRSFAWQDGYGAFSVSASNVDRVKHYIANQEEHHRTLSFEQEFVAFLRKHQIPYDERYLWK